MARRLRVAIAGLGRMGKCHALHFLSSTPRANLIAAFTPDVSDIAWAQTNLVPFGVRLYEDHDEMLNIEGAPLQNEKSAGGLEAVVIATATTVHAEEAIKAIESGFHVLCEKPLSTSIDVVSGVLPSDGSLHVIRDLEASFANEFPL